jgi:predicted DCC family thiol-disulfide oxidoreductase YuxK
VVRIDVTDAAHAGERPSGCAVLYDADCGFCKWLLSGLLRWDRAERLHLIALQPKVDELLADLPIRRRAVVDMRASFCSEFIID